MVLHLLLPGKQYTTLIRYSNTPLNDIVVNQTVQDGKTHLLINLFINNSVFIPLTMLTELFA